MENEKIFTFDVEKISNGYIVFHAGKKVHQEKSSDVNIYIEGELRSGLIAHVIEHYPKGTAQRLVVTMGVSGRVMS